MSNENRYTQFFIEAAAEQPAIAQAQDTAQSASAQLFQNVALGDKFRVRVQVTDATGEVVIPRSSVSFNVLEITDAGTTVQEGGGPGGGTWVGLTDTSNTYAVAPAGSLVRQNLNGDGIDFISNGAETQVMTIVGNVPQWAASQSGGVTTWLALNDTYPTSYAGQQGKFVQVNTTPDGLQFHALKAFQSILVAGETDIDGDYLTNPDVTFAGGLAIDITTDGTSTVTWAVDPAQIDLTDLGSKTFIELTDTPDSYTGANRLLAINDANTKVAFEQVTMDDDGIGNVTFNRGNGAINWTFSANSVGLNKIEVTNAGTGDSRLRADNVQVNDFTGINAFVTHNTDPILGELGGDRGSVLYFGASGPAVLPPGADGYALTTHGAAADPTWEEVAGGGGGDVYKTITVQRYVPGGPDDPDQTTVAAGATDTLRFNSPTSNIVFSAADASPDLVSIDLGYLSDAPSGCLWANGVFQWVSGETHIMDALCDLNSLIRGISASPAPSLSTIDANTNGENGYLTWGASQALAGYTNVSAIGALGAVDIDVEYNDSGNRIGVIRDITDTEGDIQPGVGQTLNYDAGAFAEADTGSLDLELNGIVIHSVDLTSFGSGNDLNTVGDIGSGFVNLGAVKQVTQDDGTPVPGDLFAYRGGGTPTTVARWRVDKDEAQWRNGHNYVRVIHNLAADRNTNYVDWVSDPVIDSVEDTSYSGDVFDNLVMTGSEFLSGVEYYEAGTAQFDVTIDNAYRNTYSGDSNKVVFVETNCTIPNQTLDPCQGAGQNAKTQTYTNLVATINANRLLDGDITARCFVDRVFSISETSSTIRTISGILMDTNIDDGNSTDLFETFDDEDYRMRSDLDIDDISYGPGGGSGPTLYTWDSTEHLSPSSPPPAPTPPLLVSGTAYYVSPTGDNGNSGLSTGSPWETIQHAFDNVSPGDIINLMAGTFVGTENWDFNTTKGRAGHLENFAGTAIDPLIIRRNGTDQVTIEANNSVTNSGYVCLSFHNCDYVYIEGLEFDDYRRYGIYFVDCDFCSAFKCIAHPQTWVSDTRGQFQMNESRDCEFHTCYAYGTGQVGQGSFGNIGFQMKADFTGSGSSHPMPPVDPPPSGPAVPENEWPTWPGYGSSCTRCKITNCLMHDFQANQADADGIVCKFTVDCECSFNVIWGVADDGIDLQGCARTLLDSNISFNNSGGNANGLKVSNKNGMLHRIVRNVCFNNENYGCTCEDCPNCIILNNTFINNNNGLDQWDDSSTYESVVMGNILAGNSNQDWNLTGGAGDNYEFFQHNLIENGNLDGADATGVNVLLQSPNLVQDPPIINTSITVNTVDDIETALAFIRDQVYAKVVPDTGSPCIDASITYSPYVTTFNGNSPDIGAVESGGGGGGPGPEGYADGLLTYNGACRYPTRGPFNGDFRDDSEGGSLQYSPLGNPDYSGLAGERVWIRYYYSTTATSNFNFNINVTNTAFVPASNTIENGGGGLGGNNVAAEILAPSQTNDGAATEWKDMFTPYTADSAAGAFSSGFGSSIPTNWGVTIGTKSTANSGGAIVVRFTAGAAWTGSINSVTVDFTP